MKHPTSVASQRSRVTGIGFLPAVVATVLAAACSSVGVRPYMEPLPEAMVDSLPAGPTAVIGELQDLVIGEGLTVRVSSPGEGYLETEWYDVVRRVSGGGGSLDPRNVVRLRFFADRLGSDRSVLTSEAVIRRTVDPSLPERENERMVPPGHEGEQLLQRILIALRAGLSSGGT